MILFWGSKLQLWFMSHGGLQMCKCIYTYTCSEKVKALSMSPRKLVFQSERKKNFMFVYHTHSFLFLSLLILMLSIATMTIIQICLAWCITMERTWHRYSLYLTIYILKVSYYSEFHVHKNIPLRKTEGTPKKCAPLSRSERDVKADYMHSIVFHMFYCVYRCVYVCTLFCFLLCFLRILRVWQETFTTQLWDVN